MNKNNKSIQVDFQTWKALKQKSLDEQKTINNLLKDITNTSNKPCVYKLDLKCGKSYIGSTINLYNRIQQHKSILEIQNISIVETFNTIEEARQKEVHYIITSENLINKSNIDDSNIILSDMSKFYSMILKLYFIAIYKKDILTTKNGYIRADDVNIKKQELQTQEVKEFITSISNKENLDINNIILSTRANVGTFIHPLLAFDIIINKSIKDKINLLEIIFNI